MRLFISAIFLFVLVGCQSPHGGSVRLGNGYPGPQCQTIGQVIGTSGTRENAREKAMADLKHNAALRSANFVRVLAVSAHGSAVRGIAYRCP